MARIIEYNEGEYSGSRGAGSGAAALIVVILILLYMSGYMPWFNNTSTAYERGYIAPATAGITIPTGNIGYVSAERLNMRDAPGSYSMVTYILPRGTRVTFLADSYREPNGELWVKVQIDTYEGVQTGWVNRQYIS